MVNPFTAVMSVENDQNDQNVRKFESLHIFFLFVKLAYERIFIKTNSIDFVVVVDLLWDRKIHCLQACARTFRPGTLAVKGLIGA